MRKLLLIVLIFLIIGAVSAHEDANSTAEPLLKDRQYNASIDDGDGIPVIEQDGHIPIEVSSGEAWSLNVYIDGRNSTINGELVEVNYERIDIPTSVMDDGEVPLEIGEHNITYEFRFTNTTLLYNPEAYTSDSVTHFDFKAAGISRISQNLTYRFTSQFSMTEILEPSSATFNLGDINITRSDSLFLTIRGLTSGRALLYINDTLYGSFEIDESPYEDEIDTTKLAIGSYSLSCIVETDRIYGNYSINADGSDSSLNVRFTRSQKTTSPNRYVASINATLNVCEFPELNTISIGAPQISTAYSRSIPVRFEGEGQGDFTVYIDGEKVYENSILLSWENTCYIPAKDGNGNYFSEGVHNITFEFVLSDKYSRFQPKVSWRNNALTFSFLNSRDSNAFLNDIYVADTILAISSENAQFIEIESDATVSITHTKDIKLRVEGLDDYYMTVFVDGVEIHDTHTYAKSLSIETFIARSSIEETNERDIEAGTHDIRFEFKTPYPCEAGVEFKNNALYFTFNRTDSTGDANAAGYRLNTTLTVKESEKTVHIRSTKNHTYFDDTEFEVKMDTYQPEDPNDWEDEGVENPIGTQDVGVIVSNDEGIVYMGDDLINVYKHLRWNYEFENEKLPQAGIYTIKIVNLADNTYDTASFEVKKANRIFTKKYSADDFDVAFTLDFTSSGDDLNGQCIITLDGRQKAINVKKSSSKSRREVLFTDIDPGDYTATFTLAGNGIYNDVTLKSKVIVKKENPEIECHESGGGLEVTIDIPKSKTDALLTVKAGGEEKRFTVDNATKHLSVNLANLYSGTHNVEIDFRGNERYESKTLTVPFKVTTQPKAEEPVEVNQTGTGLGNNTGGIGTGSGDSNVTGSGNGTSNGKISVAGKGFGGDFGSQGSGHGDGAKSYEITKSINPDDSTYFLAIILIMAMAILFLGFIDKRRDNDESDEY